MTVQAALKILCAVDCLDSYGEISHAIAAAEVQRFLPMQLEWAIINPLKSIMSQPLLVYR